MTMTYGISLPQGRSGDLADMQGPVEAYEMLTGIAQTADEYGYHSVWLIDHVQTFPIPSQEMNFECWTSTAALARDTKRVRIGQLVTCNGYRHPALLAKMASTVDVLSHGRLTLGIGAGGFEPEYRAYGYEYPETPERLQRLREAVQILLLMWEQEEATFEGAHYQVRGAINQPKGVQKPHIPVLIGGNGEHVLLKLVAQYGDSCNVFGDFATLARKFAVLKQHCEAVGRDYQSIRRTTETLCIIGETDEQAQALVPDALRAWYGPALQTALIGSLQTIRQRLASYEAAGIQELLLRFPHAATRLGSIQLFAQEFL